MYLSFVQIKKRPSLTINQFKPIPIMRTLIIAAIVFISAFQSNVFSQNISTPKLYAHKVIVDSIVQTKAYTYLKVKERIKEKDSLLWLALPLIEPKIGDVYYFDNGMQMGLFFSRELNRTFNQILFLGFLGTTPEVSDMNIVPVPVIDTVSSNNPPLIMHTVVVKEVIQTSGYSYLRVKEGEKEMWLAIVKIPATIGQTYTFDDAASIKDFTSKELKRTFQEVFFLAKLTLVPENKIILEKNKSKTSKKPTKAVDVSIEKLYENKKSFSEKTVRITGKVTKRTPDVMGKTWIHIEDGTSFSGKYDLTITTNQEVKVGDEIIVEGEISLNKDFGSGYFFEVMMEDGTIQKK